MDAAWVALPLDKKRCWARKNADMFGDPFRLARWSLQMITPGGHFGAGVERQCHGGCSLEFDGPWLNFM
ncbi:hypothetical protein DESC_480162 [Desulfosarcina cetonica]|nr:hypothetical protein DESC_480162 [Desulfosarcina cetonica]